MPTNDDANRKQVEAAERRFAAEEAKNPEAFAEAEQRAKQAFGPQPPGTPTPPEQAGPDFGSEPVFVPEANSVQGRASESTSDDKLQLIFEMLRDRLDRILEIMEN